MEGSFWETFLYNEESPLIFTKFYFWGFFAFVLAVYSFIYPKRAVRNAFIFAVSLYFYYKTSGLYFFLLIFSTITDFSIGLIMHRSKKKAARLTFLVLSIVINLLVLSYFKYSEFFVDTFNYLFDGNLEVHNYVADWINAFGADLDVGKIFLPVGISFFTFQTISYAVDVYQGKVEPVRNILDFGFYVSFFPQLVAGPIVRASEFIPQLYKPYSLTRFQFGLALFWILQGMTKKIFLADFVASNFADPIFDNPQLYDGFSNLMALYAYSLQVYADFSGYTDIAIGVALLMGFHLPTNFNSPYKAKNVGDFWKRWHISLSTWLKDYLYIPTGGSRKSSFLTYAFFPICLLLVTIIIGFENSPVVLFGSVIAILLYLWVIYYFPKVAKEMSTSVNLMITMLLGGLWHGASWLFVVWGGLNGIGLVVYKQWRKISPWEGKDQWFFRAWSIFITFNFITFTRIWFRCEEWPDAMNMLHQIGNNFDLSVIPEVISSYGHIFLVIVAGYIIHWLPVNMKTTYREGFIRLPYWAMILISVVVVFAVYQVISTGLQPFIYFQF